MNQPTPRLREGTLPTQATRMGLQQDPHLTSVPAAIKNVRTRVFSTLLTSNMVFPPELAYLHEVLLEYMQLIYRLYGALTWLNPDVVERMVVIGRMDQDGTCTTRTWALRGDVQYDDAELLRNIEKYQPQLLIYLQGGRVQGVVQQQPGMENLLISATVVLPSVQGMVRYSVSRRQGVPIGFQLQCDIGARPEPAEGSLPVYFAPLANHDAMLQEAIQQEAQARALARAAQQAQQQLPAAASAPQGIGMTPPPLEGEGGGPAGSATGHPDTADLDSEPPDDGDDAGDDGDDDGELQMFFTSTDDDESEGVADDGADAVGDEPATADVLPADDPAAGASANEGVPGSAATGDVPADNPPPPSGPSPFPNNLLDRPATSPRPGDSF